MKSTLFITAFSVVLCLPLSLPSRASDRQCNPGYCSETICKDRPTEVYDSSLRKYVTRYQFRCQLDFDYGPRGIYETPLPQKSSPEKSLNLGGDLSPNNLDFNNIFKGLDFSNIFKNSNSPTTPKDGSLNFGVSNKLFGDRFLDNLFKGVDFGDVNIDIEKYIIKK